MSDKRTFVTLDGLRGLAALMVLTRHAPDFFASVSIMVPSAHGDPVPVGPFFESYLAVDLFFVLSGFVLEHAYRERLLDGMTVGRFMLIRAIRLYPLYFLALVISLVATEREVAYGHLAPSTLAIDAICALLFLPSPMSTVLFPLNVPAWSLFSEVGANAVFAATRKHLTNSKLAIFTLSAAILLALSSIQRWFGFGAANIGALADGFQWLAWPVGFVRVAFSFAAGMVVYRFWSATKPRFTVPPLPIGIILVVILALHPAEHLQIAYDLTAAIVVFPALVFFGACSQPSGRVSHLFALAGTASYGLYVLQFPLFFLSRLAAIKLAGASSFSIAYGLAFTIGTFAFALLADYCFDSPVRRAATRIFLQPRRVARA